MKKDKLYASRSENEDGGYTLSAAGDIKQLKPEIDDLLAKAEHVTDPVEIGKVLGEIECLPITSGNDPALLAQFANLLDDTALKVLTIIQDGERSVDDKLRLLSALDVRHYGKASKQLADLLGVTEQAVRKTDWWRVDRHQRD